MHEQLTEHFVNNLLFNPQQYGFRKNSSTELAALELIDRLVNQLNNHSIPINFYIDLSKAFDSLRHDILIEKLAYYGVKNKALDLLKSYLSNRKQYVKLNDITSTVRSISVGVPQGSIIGPLLFNIFINDIVKANTKFSFILYADDTTLNSTLDCFGQNVIEIQEAIVAELQKVFKWLKLNILSLNVAKSKFMLFHMPQKVVPELSFTINDMVIDHVKEFTFLGLILDSNLNWNAHLNSIGSKIARVIGLLRKLKYIFLKHILRSIYNSLILPHMNYSLSAWGNKCNKIELLQKKAVRLINLKTPIAHTEPLLKKMKQVKLSDLYTCHLLKLYYKLYRNRLPPYFDNFFTGIW